MTTRVGMWFVVAMVAGLRAAVAFEGGGNGASRRPTGPVPPEPDLVQPPGKPAPEVEPELSPQTPAESAAPARRPTPVPVHAVRTRRPPVIDGRLDDPAWADAKVFDAFHLNQPVEGGIASERSELRVLFDD